MIKHGIYCVHDNVSGENGLPVFSASDESFMRDFGIAFSKCDVPVSMANQWTGVRLGDIEIHDNPHTLPRLIGYESPFPVCTAAEAMAMYRDLAPECSGDKEEPENG